MDITGRFSTIISTIRTKGLIYNNNFNIVTSYGIYTHGNDSYYDNINSNDCADTFGKVTQYTIVLENNNWTGYYDHLMDSRTGGSYIFRYNNVTFSVDGAGPLETHGPIWTDPYPTPTDSGGNRFEVYNNTIGNLPGVTSGSSGIFLRGGCWLVYNNKIKDKAQGVMLQVEGSPPWPCSVDLYPVYHQPKDIWIYNNVFSNLSRGDVEVSSPDSTPCIQENRDYYLRAPNLAQDGFTYTPYPYPHPLTQVS